VNEHLWWYLTRASGLVAWALLTLAVALGLVVRTKVGAAPAKPPWWLDMHRFAGALATLFTGVHLATLVADSYVDFGLADLVIPGASGWKPGPVALGVVSLWLLLTVEITSLLQRHLPRRLWRALHLTSYPLFWMATLHFALAGSDARHPLAVGAILLAIGSTVFFTAARVLLPRRKRTIGPVGAAPGSRC
jgi:hypothetical protein